jgi:hypothetical protein
MTSNVLTVTELVRHFSDYISRVAYKHETFILRKGNKLMAELRPAPTGIKLGDLPGILASLPHLSAADVDTYAKDIADARASLPNNDMKDPWAF